MLPLLRQLTGHVKVLLNRFPPERRTSVVVSFGLMLAAAIGLLVWAFRPQYKTLYSDLSLEDSGEIVQVLQKDHVPYRLGQEGRRILVPANKLYETRLKLAADQLPREHGTGWELFDQSSLGVTDFVQKLNFRRALEGELARTILQIDLIEAVRVHLVIPEESLFKENQKQANASVTMRLKRGQKLTPAQVEGVVYLVSSAVPGLAPENVTVIDSRGYILTEMVESDPMMRLSGSQLELQKRVEAGLVKKGQDLLDKRFGSGRSAIQVTAQLDFEQRERQSDTYDADNPAIRSEEVTSSTSTGADTTSSRTENNVTNYELNLTREKVTSAIGDIRRLSVAVMVDGRYETVEGPASGKKNREFSPLPPSELDEIARTIEAALGYNSSRGDEISVVSAPFQDANLMDEADLVTVNRWDMVFRYGQKVLTLAAIVLLLLMVRSFLRRAQASALMLSPRPQLPAAAPRPSLPEFGAAVDDETRLRLARQEQITSFVEEKPEIAARLVRSWLVEE